MPKVRIPTPLRKYTSGQKEVSAEGGTVAEVLINLGERYPGIRQAIYDESGKLQNFVHIYVGELPAHAMLDAAVAETSEISIVPAIAGGLARTLPTD